MNLQRKSLLLFVLLYFTLSAAVGLTLWKVVLDRFASIENRYITQDLKRACNALVREAERLRQFAVDWGEWDETWHYFADPDPEYEAANLIPESLDAINADGLFLLNNDGRVLHGLLRKSLTGEPVVSDTLNSHHWPIDHPLLQALQSGEPAVILTDNGPALFGRSPVLRSDRSGARRGNLVFVRFLDQRFLDQLQQQLQLPVSIRIAGGAVGQDSVAIEFLADDLARASLSVPLLGTRDWHLVLSAEFGRPVHMQALSTIELAIGLILAVGLLFSVAGYYAFQRHLIRPIIHLTERAAEFGRRKNELPAPMFRSRFDEVGELARTLQEMARSIRSQQEKLIDERRKAEMDSWTDPLTGLHNRRYLRRFLSRSEPPENEPVWLFLLVDIDHFKSINDSYGHDVGDLVLCQFTSVIRSCIRSSDIAIRMGGEEFMLVCRESSQEQGSEIAERLRRQVARTSFGVENESFNITCSIGYLSCEPREDNLHSNWRSIMKLTDIALYAAKRSGRNAWIGLNCLDREIHRWFPDSPDALQDKLRLEQISVSASTSQVIWR